MNDICYGNVNHAVGNSSYIQSVEQLPQIGREEIVHLLIYVCMASKWPEAIPLKSITSRAVLDALVEIFTRNGIPMSVLSDQGSQFSGSLMKELCELFGIDKISTTAYRPQSNGLLERLSWHPCTHY